MRTIDLIQAWHIHQPVTQDIRFVDRAVGQAYRNLLDTYADFPDIRWNLNVTGALLEVLLARHADLVDRIAEGVSSDRIELLTTAYHQPFIPLIPAEHAVAHVRKNTDLLEETFGVRPTAAWVPERVWEPKQVGVWADAGVGAVLLDDHLLFKRDAALPESERYRAHRATHGDRSITVLPIDRTMRYLIPWRPVDEVVAYLEKVRDACEGHAVVVFGDDGEKMGEWPHTEGTHAWLRSFLERLSDLDWVRFTTAGAYASEGSAAPESAFPAGAYPEMEEWALGDVANFTKHPLVRPMYERLLRARRRIGGWNEPLLRAESSDPFWYARMMGFHRQMTYHNILKAEQEAGVPAPEGPECRHEGKVLLLRFPGSELVIDATGRIVEWDLLDHLWNVVNTGFFASIAEKNALVPSHLGEPRRDCLTDFIDGEMDLGPWTLHAEEGAAVLRRSRFDVQMEKRFVPRQAAGEWVLEVAYRMTNTGSDGVVFRLVPEICFTPPTDFVDETLRPQHRVLFDYAGAVVDRPVESAKDGEGVCWSGVVDRVEELVMGAAWAAGAITAHERGTAGGAVTLKPIFKPVHLLPGSEHNLRLALYAGEGDHTVLHAMFTSLYYKPSATEPEP